MEEIKRFISKYVQVNEHEWSDFASCLHQQSLPKRTLLLTENEKCDFIAFVSEGSFRYFHVKEGLEKVTGLFFAGDVVSDYASFLTDSPSNHTIESIAPSVVYKLYKSDLSRLYEKHKSMETLGRKVAENLFLSLDNRLNTFLYLSPEQRYHELIKRNPNLPQWVPQYMIASYLGVEPETLSRIRKRKK